MSDKFFAFTNINDIRDEYFYLEDYVLYEDSGVVLGGNRNRFAQNQNYAILMIGSVYNIGDFIKKSDTSTDAEIILNMIDGVDFGDLCRKFTGSFCIMLYDKTEKTWKLATDIFGQFCPYYYLDDDEFIVSTDFYDFHKEFFEIDSDLFSDSFAYSHDQTKTILPGVKRVQSGTILMWPECEQEIYIDLYEELEESYTNRVDISFDDAVKYVLDTLTSSVKRIIHGKDKTKIGVVVSNGIADAVTIAILNKCGVSPYLYAPYISIMENENNKRMYDFEDMLSHVKYEDIVKIPYECSKADEYFCNELEQPIFHTSMENTLCFNPIIIEKIKENELECLLTSDGANTIFLQWTMYYILYKLENDDTYKNRTDLSPKQIKELFSDKLYDTSLYSFGSFSERLLTDYDGLLDRLSSDNIFMEKTDSSDYDYISLDVNRINLYKNHNLLGFVLSLPGDIIESSMLNAELLNGVFKKVTRRKKDVIKFKRRDSWNVISKGKVFDETTNRFVNVDHDILYTECLAELLIDAVVFFQDLGINVHQLWDIEDKQDENTEKMLPRSLQLIFKYKQLKAWGQGYHYAPRSINNK